MTVAFRANIALAIYLLLIGLNILFDLSVASWVLGVLALVAGVLMLLERFGFSLGSRKK
jgi:uncharacterized membrane protein HdeD (DUF308 family)